MELLSASGSDPAVFAEFYRRHVDSLTSWCFRRTRDAEGAADVVMETLAAAFAMRQRFQAHHETALARLCGIARRNLARLARGRRLSTKYRAKLGLATQAQLSGTDHERIERLVDQAPLRLALREALAQRPQRDATAIWLRVALELPYSEIAIRLGCSPGAATVRVFRGLGRLHNALEVV